VNETGRMSELSVLDITAFNERRGASSLDVYWQHHHAASIRTCKSIEAAILAVKEEQIIPSDETRRMSELSVLDITAFNERRGASSLEVDWQHHHASIRTCKSIEAAILVAAEEEQRTPSDETNNDDCIAVPRPIDVLMGREKLALAHAGNAYYQSLIRQYQDRYDACETRIEKTIIASTLAMKIKESGGRFLLRKKGETTWSEAAESVVSEKVTNAFRGRRKTAIKRNKRSYDGTPDTASKRRLPDVYAPYS
jgi:hypothetical protein